MANIPKGQSHIPAQFRVAKTRMGSQTPYGKVICKCGRKYIDRLDSKALGLCPHCRMVQKRKRWREVARNSRERLRLRRKKEIIKETVICIECNKPFVTIKGTHSMCKQCRRKYYNKMWYERQRDRYRELPKRYNGGGGFSKVEYKHWDIYLKERQACTIKSLLKKRNK